MTITMSQRRSCDRVNEISLDPQEIRFYREEGYLPLPGLLAPDIAEAARLEVLEVVRVAQGIYGAEGRDGEGKARRLVQSSQYLAGSVLDGVVNSSRLQQLAGALMGGDASLYLPFTAVKSGGGGGSFSFHQDNQYTRFTDGLRGINIWLALCEMTPANGCLRMCPRSHRRGQLESVVGEEGEKRMKIEPEQFVPIRMRAGDAVAFSRLTVHGSGENRTDRPRVAYAVQFFRDDAEAVWDNQPPRRLKGASRWPVGPVQQLSAPTRTTQDGH